MVYEIKHVVLLTDMLYFICHNTLGWKASKIVYRNRPRQRPSKSWPTRYVLSSSLLSRRYMFQLQEYRIL